MNEKYGPIPPVDYVDVTTPYGIRRDFLLDGRAEYSRYVRGSEPPPKTSRRPRRVLRGVKGVVKLHEYIEPGLILLAHLIAQWLSRK